MAFFGKSISKPIIQIKKESIPANPASNREPYQGTARPSLPKRNTSKSDLRKSSNKTSARDQSQPRKRKRTNLNSNSWQTFDEDSEDDEDDTDTKRSRSTSAIPKVADGEDLIDFNRRLRLEMDSTETPARKISIIHADEVACLGKDKKFVPALGAGLEDDVKVELYYPGASQPERYQIVYAHDKLESHKEIFRIAQSLPDVYLTPEQAEEFTDPNTGIIRKLQAAMNNKNFVKFKEAILLYNAKVKQYRKEGVFAKNLELRHDLPHHFISLVLDQIYDRAVSPSVDTLRRYENGTDDVYGELKYPLITRIFKFTKLKSDQIFLDLGSGCGNVVLQAALQIGCESWGCEKMPNACTLASKQKKEFTARCRLWGIAPGKIHLEKGDFLENEATLRILKKADVILVNNQAFTPATNDKLKMLFLDLKHGCKVVSLKPFVRHESSSRNENDLGNVFGESVKYDLSPGDVSWTDSGVGNYYIATRGGPKS